MGQELTNYDAQLAAMAARYAEQEQLAGGTFLSTRGGTLSFGDNPLPGNQACVIILDSVKENTYYGADFDPDAPAAPQCYAFGRDNDPMGPHPSMQVDLNYFKPQATDCAACPWNEWGSADKGRGKACQNRRRLALVPAGYYAPKRGSRDFDLEVFTDPKHFKEAEIAFIKLPVLSVKNWSKYVTQIANSLHRPPQGVLTRLFLEPDPKSQYQVHFEMIDEVSADILPVVLNRFEEAAKAVISGYKPPELKDQAPRQQGSLRGLRGQR